MKCLSDCVIHGRIILPEMKFLQISFPVYLSRIEQSNGSKNHGYTLPLRKLQRTLALAGFHYRVLCLFTNGFSEEETNCTYVTNYILSVVDVYD